MNSEVQQLVDERNRKVRARLDRMFGIVLLVEWAVAIMVSLLVSPYTWIGTRELVHMHVWAALLGGALLSLPPFILSRKHPGEALTRHLIAMTQMIFSALFIHLSGGRLETHFHVFGSLAFLAMYRDWRVLLNATLVVAFDHFLRGTFFPMSVFGVLSPSQWRWLEHAAWVIFEDFFLIRSCLDSQIETIELATQTVELRTLQEAEARRVQDERQRRQSVVKETASVWDGAVDCLLSSSSNIEGCANNSRVVRHAMDLAQNEVAIVTTCLDRVVSTTRTIQDASINGKKIAIGTGETVEKMLIAVEQMGGVLDLIENIAETTNLLALNAAIQAVNAGEAGKAFRVVAEEVKELADQTGQATDSVRADLLEVQKWAQETVLAVSELSKATVNIEALQSEIIDAVSEQEHSIQILQQRFTENIISTSEISEGLEYLSTATREVSQTLEDARGRILQQVA